MLFKKKVSHITADIRRRELKEINETIRIRTICLRMGYEAEAETERKTKACMTSGYIRMISSWASRRVCLVVGSYAIFT